MKPNSLTPKCCHGCDHTNAVEYRMAAIAKTIRRIETLILQFMRRGRTTPPDSFNQVADRTFH